MNFSSYSKCRKELSNIDITIKYIEEELSNNITIYNLFCKGNFIIIGTLFESFCENIIQEYIDFITIEFNNNRISFTKLPNSLQKYISKKLVSKHFKKEFETMHSEQSIDMMSKFLISLNNNPFIIDNELEEINKFSFGKHGETELKKLFKRVGIDIQNYFTNFSELNNYFNLRNGIIHPQDILTTTTINIDDLKNYNKLLKIYIYESKRVLNKELKNLNLIV